MALSLSRLVLAHLSRRWKLNNDTARLDDVMRIVYREDDSPVHFLYMATGNYDTGDETDTHRIYQRHMDWLQVRNDLLSMRLS
jgi:hypothetical protein